MRILVAVLLMSVSTGALGQSEDALRKSFEQFTAKVEEHSAKVALTHEDEQQCLGGPTPQQCAEKTAVLCRSVRAMLSDIDRGIIELRQVLSKHPHRYSREGRPYRDSLLDATMASTHMHSVFSKDNRCQGIE